MFFQQSLEGIVDMTALLFCLQWGVGNKKSECETPSSTKNAL